MDVWHASEKQTDHDELLIGSHNHAWCIEVMHV